LSFDLVGSPFVLGQVDDQLLDPVEIRFPSLAYTRMHRPILTASGHKPTWTKRMGRRNLSQFGHGDRLAFCFHSWVSPLIWLALCAAGTVFAAEDRWLVEPSGSTRSVRTRTTGGPRR
jgi:hypothetical protein